MDQIGDGLKKMVQAGFGAVATGVEKTQGAITRFAKKGEPIYEQAKSAVTETTDKIKKAVQEGKVGEMLSCRPRVESIIADLQEMTQEELDEIRQALEDIYPTRPASREEAPAPEAEETPDEEDSDEE